MEEILNNVKHLEVVLLDGHLKVETGELRKVTVREALLSPEDRTNLEYLLEVGADSHLLVQLR